MPADVVPVDVFGVASCRVCAVPGVTWPGCAVMPWRLVRNSLRKFSCLLARNSGFVVACVVLDKAPVCNFVFGIKPVFGCVLPRGVPVILLVPPGVLPVKFRVRGILE